MPYWTQGHQFEHFKKIACCLFLFGIEDIWNLFECHSCGGNEENEHINMDENEGELNKKEYS